MALQGSVREIRTNEEISASKMKKIKNSQPQTKFTGSYKKKGVYIVHKQKQLTIGLI